MGVVKYFSPSLLDGSVTTAKLADGAVTEAKLAALSISAGKIQVNAVGGNQIQSGAVHQGRLGTTIVSTSGNITAGTAANIVLLPFAFWPMIHVQDPVDVSVSGHLTDAPGADNPRFAFFNSGVADRTYDVDYRYVIV